MPTLNDTRTLSLDEAPGLLEQIARASCRIERARATYEEQIARRRSAFVEATCDDEQLVDQLADRLSRIIDAHPDAFKRPRAVTTAFGRFGRRKVSNVLVEDADAAVEYALDSGYADLVKTVHKLQRSALAKRLRAGEDIPGVGLETGERSFYEVDRTLLKQARGDA